MGTGVPAKLFSDWDRFLPYRVLLAVSGGADSTALFCRFVQTAGKQTDTLAVGHVNHGLRGEESDADAEFVRNLAERYRIRYIEHRMEPEEWTLDESGSFEAAARRIRYDFLTRTADKLGFRYVAVAHTADDQA
jgi:tRNA(Ile)-lysidine synthase